MIKADHKKWAKKIFDLYLSTIIRKDFNEFYIVDKIPEFTNNRGLIITPNHFSWWDGFFIYYLMNKISDRKIYIMMLENQLEKYSFFRKLGAFSIDQQNPKGIVNSLNYASSTISKAAYLVTYPQGEIEPYEKRPLTFKDGLFKILEKTKTESDILPVTFKIHHSNLRKPDVYALFGKSESSKDVVSAPQNYILNFNNLISKLDSCFLNSSKTSLFNK